MKRNYIFLKAAAILASVALCIGTAGAFSADATFIRVDDTFSFVDDSGWAAQNCTYDGRFDPDNYVVLEKQGYSEDSGSFAVYSGFKYCSVWLDVYDQDVYQEIYDEYADTLDFEEYYAYPINGTYFLYRVFLYDKDPACIENFEEKLPAVTAFVDALNDAGIVQSATYTPFAYSQICATTFSRYMTIDLPEEDGEALADLCAQYGAEVLYYGDADAYQSKMYTEKLMASYADREDLSDAARAMYIAQCEESIAQYEEQMENVSPEDCAFLIAGSDSFSQQTALWRALSDAYPESGVFIYINGDESEGESFDPFEVETIDLLAQTEDNPSEDNAMDIICGDVNFDGKVELSDVVTLSKAASGVMDITENILAAGDLDGDGAVTEDDAMILLEFEMGLIRAIPLTPDA